MPPVTRPFEDEFLRIGDDAVIVHAVSDGAVVDCNEQALDLFGLEIDALDELRLDAIYGDRAPYDVEAMRAHLTRARKMGSHRFEWERRAPTGETQRFDVTLRVLSLGGAARLIAVLRDITPQWIAARELESAKAFLAAAIHQSPAGIAVFGSDPDRIDVLNAAARRILGVPSSGPPPREALLPVSELLRGDGTPFPAGGDPVSRAVIGREVVQNEDCGFRRPDGTIGWILVSAAPVTNERDERLGAVLIFSDVSELRHAAEQRRVLEKQLIRSQRIEAVNALAAGVAHQINNPLMGIMSRAELIALEAEDTEACRAHAEVIASLCERMASIVRDLVGFARADSPTFEPTDTVALARSTLEMLGPQLRRAGIHGELDAADDLVPVACRSGQIRQVLVNLVQNAVQAIAERAEEGRREVVLRGRRGEGEAVRWSVVDTGVGMGEEVAGRAFDPFFTTQPPGEGAGLGLSACHTIVGAHHGRIWIESTSELGTTVSVELPIDPVARAGREAP